MGRLSMKNVEKTTVKNNFGVDIVVCCASCEFKAFKNDKARLCTLSKLETHPSEFCSSWKMADHLQLCGRGGGRVKRKAWFDYVKEFGRSEHSIKEFERQYGSRFLNNK